MSPIYAKFLDCCQKLNRECGFGGIAGNLCRGWSDERRAENYFFAA